MAECAAGPRTARKQGPAGTRDAHVHPLALYERRRRGQISDEVWARTEPDIFVAQFDGRLKAPPYFTK